jgi:hypothetical protein
MLSMYVFRVYMLNGWFIVSYGLGIYLLNQLIGFLSPQVCYIRSYILLHAWPGCLLFFMPYYLLFISISVRPRGGGRRHDPAHTRFGGVPVSNYSYIL